MLTTKDRIICCVIAVIMLWVGMCLDCFETDACFSRAENEYGQCTIESAAYFIDGEIVGIIATRNQNSHISLFFVKDSFMGKGIGRKLINEIIINNKNEKVTVHSSPFAVKIYEKLGFIKTSQEKCINGMLFIEMEHLIDK